MHACTNKPRRARGSNIAELAPALLLLFLFIFFPLLDLIAIAVDYAAGHVLNHTQLRRAALIPKSEAIDSSGIIMKGIPDAWKNSGLGKFVGVVSGPTTKVTYREGQKDILGTQDRYVVVTTEITSRPFMVIPLIPNVPGLSAPMKFSFTGERPLEDPSHFDM